MEYSMFFVRNLSKFILLTSFVSTASLGALCNNGLESANSTIGPDLRLTLVKDWNYSHDAAAFLGEVGTHNFRLGGTYGRYVTDTQRLKFGGEYLTQGLKYNYSPGKEHHSVNQYALGTKYQFILDNCYISATEIGGYYSHANNKSFDPYFCADRFVLVSRQIAGSDAYGFSADATIVPSDNNLLTISALYDHVNYKRIFNDHNEVSGLGIGLDFCQELPCNFSFDIKAEIRRPFNFFEAKLVWTAALCESDITVGVYANYTKSKRFSLPNVAGVGFELCYVFGSFEDPTYCDQKASYPCNDLVCWVAKPAVYMPIVLAASEQNEVPVLPN
jgi:hypothetical protein